jgi:hypothetical protein
LARVRNPCPGDNIEIDIVPRTGLAQTCKRTEKLQKPPLTVL